MWTGSLPAGRKGLVGGTRDGPFNPPTVMVDVTPRMPAFDEEVFGPYSGCHHLHRDPGVPVLTRAPRS
ncbi:aldehyde dehydrogenase family protein [Streptomyces sp. SID13031]|nr:aldehyde dehydrogenase family protein [Streptomyces sp. SID13031]